MSLLNEMSVKPEAEREAPDGRALARPAVTSCW